MITIRLAEEKDYEEVLEMMQEIHSLHVQNRPDIYLDTNDCYPHSFFMDQVKSNSLLVADMDGKVAGLLAFCIRNSNSPVHVPRKVLYVDIVGVKDGCRHMGIGHTMFDRVHEIAMDDGCDAMELDVNAWNKDALELYEKLGFQEDWKRMSLSLKN